MTVLEYIISALTPLECYICNTEEAMLCSGCAEKVLPQQISRCYICNKLTKQHTVCSSCRSNSALRRVWWLGLYKDELKWLVYSLKFQRKRAYGKAFGQLLSDRLPYVPEDTVVVAIPTASKRIRQRGFNQAVLIAKSFAAQHNLLYKDLLIRTDQAEQIGKRRADRIKQMSENLGVRDHNAIKDRSILLIDDVLTTGATLEAAAKLLRQNGAKHIDAAVVARHLFS